MQTFQLEKDIALLGIQANSFPGGVQQAWQDLHQRLSTTEGRNFYGISHGTKNGLIVYKACVEESVDGEATLLGCERFILPKGEYRGERINDFMQKIHRIGETFQAILSSEDYDKNGVCVERYLNEKDVVCMIKRK